MYKVEHEDEFDVNETKNFPQRADSCASVQFLNSFSAL